MTKRRWWCFICPVGGLLSLLKRFSFFRVKIDKEKCIKCMDCVQECPVYAMTPKSVEVGESLGENCIRCGRCIEVCPDEAIDIYWFGRQRKAKTQFISIVIATVFAIYIWFVVLFISHLNKLGDFNWLG
jgi:ferredoxin-type protein NapH